MRLRGSDGNRLAVGLNGAAGDAPPDALVVTRGHVQPTRVDGALVLLTQPAVGGTLVPFESPTPTRCCVDQ